MFRVRVYGSLENSLKFRRVQVRVCMEVFHNSAVTGSRCTYEKVYVRTKFECCTRTFFNGHTRRTLGIVPRAYIIYSSSGYGYKCRTEQVPLRVIPGKYPGYYGSSRSLQNTPLHAEHRYLLRTTPGYMAVGYGLPGYFTICYWQTGTRCLTVGSGRYQGERVENPSVYWFDFVSPNPENNPKHSPIFTGPLMVLFF